MSGAQVTRLLERHRSSGRTFSADGISSFVLDDGPRDSPPVVCVHGVPASAYLYRKVVPALAAEGLRGIAVDLPGLGFAERPADGDYSWTGLGRWLLSAIDALGLERFHLVVHDIGGPIGFEVATAVPDRLLSMTVLNTIIEVQSFHRPWPMEPFAHRGIGEAWLASMHLPGAFLSIMRLVGVSRRVPAAELACWLPLLFGDDGGRAFLKIMRGFELTAAKQRRYLDAVRDTPYPVQIVWGARDTMLPWRRYGVQAQRAAGVRDPIILPAKHFLQEDHPEEIAAAVRRIATTGG
ncbi:alpha/beta fold hydrolase [Mycobacterium sp. 852002-51057_SCH5723018]|uniref:alpha/beta fold hydrolase n=1 Tax=Mycobacterium sp. 852002-51057_SCH5723018 TaxID=1834094 RepID=UPI000800D739|nr:alpha/beta fold hydrolase [Mycobacterium sp. 852002-51057_SCH5723018]OBG24221.1 haloalkane dehalogenase [Mycobacterium sp. 852002-51057_SCH5723018]